MQLHSLDFARCDASDLAAALDAYEVTCFQLVNRWKHTGLYAQAGAAIAAIRELGVPAPTLTVLTLQLVIAHGELESVLWRQFTVDEVSPETLQQVVSRHAVALQDLRLAAQKILVN